ncbi:MAG: DUF3298 and DUF4163 domain-containing protein [Clostridia bacterium]|nr:DUF3298 and DUF4163 domain-containing protein [Clostridia bacterium]
MFNIEKKVIRGELKYKETVILTYDIEYPQIFSNYYDTRKFNTLNYNKALELEKYAKENLFPDAKATYDYNSSNGFPIMVYELVFKYTITLNQAPIISLYQDEYIFTGGAHGSTVRTSQNWNLEYNSQFSLDDVYYNNPNYILYILKEINSQIKEKGEDIFFDDYCSLVLETFNPHQFYLTPNNVIIFFQQYDIAPYSTGIPTFELSY